MRWRLERDAGRLPICAEGLRRQFLHDGQVVGGRPGPVRLQQGRLERGGGQGLEIAPADLGVGVFAGDHLALLGDADLTLQGAGRLRQDRLKARPTAAADRAAAAME